MAVSLHLSISFLTYCNGVLSQQPVSGYNIAIIIIITVFLFYYYFFFVSNRDCFVLPFCTFRWSTDLHAISDRLLHCVSCFQPPSYAFGHRTCVFILFIYLFFLGLKLCEMTRSGSSRPMPNLACFSIAIFSIISALSVSPALKFLPC